MKAILFLFIFSMVGYYSFGQDKKDSANTSIAQKALGQGIKLITRSGDDSIIVESSYEQFLPFSEKVIRNIYVESIGFEKSIYGNEKPIIQKVGKIANKLHTNTREKTIRQNLFFKPNEKLNPYKLGDNERFLRDQDFILESRIIVTFVEATDSVDITVVTRDVFSIGLSVGGTIPTAPKFDLYDSNLDGRGQRVEFSVLFDPDRNPKTGFGASYKKTSFMGSFVDLEFFYSELNTGISYGEEREYATGIVFERKLVSPYSRLAGGGQWSKNWSKNLYSRPDSLFLDYSYNVIDFWIGYNFGTQKQILDRNRTFLAIRAFDGNFTRTPNQEDYFRDNIYNNVNGILSSLTFYKRDFFKTQYIYGFGRTEDVPYGYSFTSTLGWARQLSVQRPYVGIELNYKGAFRSGNFYEIDLKTSSFFRNSGLEDAIVYSTVSYFTRAFSLNRFKVRNEVGFTFTKLINRYALDWLEIYSQIIPGLRVRELQADQRQSINLQTTLFTPWSVIGFRIAPFTAFNMAVMNCQDCEKNANTFLGISTGVRIRNENLIFGTIELRGTYIPEDESGSPKFSFKFRQNLRFRKTDSFVTAPSFIKYNY